MNRLDPPDFFDDAAALDALALNVRLKCHPHLAVQVPAIKAGYLQYIAAGGDALNVANVALPDRIKDQLRALYSSPSKEVPHIKRIREESEANCCPMCGSFHSGTLDHLFPKAEYPVFAIFSPNLVPACKCNSTRTDLLTGGNANERILHPYFDDILSDRLLKAHFDDFGLVPRTELRLLIEPEHPFATAANFHLANVVERTSILRHLRTNWSNLLRRPSLTASELRHPPASREVLEEILLAELDRQDDTHGSRNNWQSVFLAGLLDAPLLDWLFDMFHQPERGTDGSLIPDLVQVRTSSDSAINIS